MKKKIDYIQNLDIVLSLINENQGLFAETFAEIKKRLWTEKQVMFDDKNLALMLNKLSEENLVMVSHPRIANLIDHHTNLYYVSFEGKHFIENGGFNKKRRKERIAYCYRIFKIIIIVLNSIAIIGVAVWGVYEQRMQRLENKKSLQTDQNDNKPPPLINNSSLKKENKINK